MIESSKMLQLITQINTTSGVSILRADQMAKKPSYPYATYKEILSNEEPSVSNIITSTYNALTNEKTEIVNELSETTISVNVYSNSHAEAKTKASILYYALKTKAVNQKASDLNMTILLGLIAIQDRTILFEGVSYEHCFGFDFIIRAMTAHTEIVKGITTVTGTIETTNEIITNEINYEVNG